MARPERLGAADEPFWLQQEARLTDQLGQPCCSVSGMCTLLGRIPGPLAVILHGERDCGNSFVNHRMPSPHRFFTTAVTEEEATTGRVDAPLGECLRLVLEEASPAAVLVLHTCLLSMIGSDPRRVIEEVVKETGTKVPVLYLETGGLRLISQADMADWLYATLAALPQLPAGASDWRKRWLTLLESQGRLLRRSLREASDVQPSAPQGAADPSAPQGTVETEPFLGVLRGAATSALPAPARQVNLIGVEPMGVRRSEAIEALAAAGVQVAGLFPEAAPLDLWRGISRADLNAVVDVRLYPRLLRQLEQGYGMKTVEVPLPTGLAQTERFYALLGDRLGVARELGAALEAHRAAAVAAVERFRHRVSGIRLALGLRMLNNYVADQLAYGGLGDLMAFQELGFDITLLVQGPPEAARRFEGMLAALGCELPMKVFPSPWKLASLLSQGGFEVAYLADHAAEEAHKAGVPMMRSRTLEPFFTGIAPNLELLGELLQLAGRDARVEAP